MANNPVDSDPFNFSKLSVPELRKVVVDQVKQINGLNEQKKDYVAATNEVIKDCKKKIDAAIVAMNTAEQVATQNALELAGNAYLAGEAAKLDNSTTN